MLFISILSLRHPINLGFDELTAFGVSCLMMLGAYLLKRDLVAINTANAKYKQTEDALRISEARYRSYLDMTQIGWGWVTNAKGEVFDDIPSFRKFNGQTYEEVRGYGWTKTLHPDDVERTIQAWNNAVAEKKLFETEYRMKRHDGVYRNILARGVPVFKEDGSITEWVGACIDITHNKKAEQEFLLVKQRLELAIRSANLGIWDWEITNNIMTWDDKMLELYGLTRETFPGGVEAWQNGLHPEDRERIIEENNAVLRGDKEWDSEFRVLQPNGTVKYIKAIGMVVWDKEGNPVRHLGINYDITERKLMEIQILKTKEELEQKVTERTRELSLANEELMASINEKEELFDELNNIFSLSYDMICILDNNGYFIKINPACEKTLGYSKDELLGRPYLDFVHPDDREKTLTTLNMMLETGPSLTYFENRYLCKYGTYKWLEWTSNLVFEKGKAYSIARDITERKYSEAVLQQSEEKFRTLFETSIDALFIVDLNGNLLDINKTAYERLGYTKEEMLSMPLSKLDSPEFAAILQNRIKYMQEHGKGVFESVHLKKDGSMMPVEINAKMIDFEESKVIFSVIRDITERKQAESALKQSEEKFRTLFESSLDALFIFDLNGNLIDINKTAYQRLGYTKEEMLSMNLYQIDHPDFTDGIPERMELMKQHGHAVFELAHLKKDGSVMPVEINAQYMEFQGRQVFFSIIRDITERKKAEEKIIQSLKEKETLLKELYHRTKNNMQVIVSFINLQSRDIDDKKTLQILDDTKNRIFSMSLVHEKLYKAKNLSQIYLRDYIKDLSDALMKGYYRDKERISISVDIEDIMVSIDIIISLGLVINELLTNALKYAFPDNKKGGIAIKGYIKEDKEIELTFSDNGIGIPQGIDITNIQSLGLTIVHTLVVSQIKGKLKIITKNGTTFVISFRDSGVQLGI